MKRALTFIASLLISLALLGAGSWAVFILLRWFIRNLLKVPAELSVALVAGSFTILVSISSVALTRYLESRANLRKEHREKKVPIYEDLLKFMFRLLMAEKLHDKVSEDEIIRWFSEFNQRLMVWGSDSVLKSFVDFRNVFSNPDNPPTPTKMMLQYERLILEIRKDLGHKNKGIAKGDVLSLFINDVRSLLNEKG